MYSPKFGRPKDFYPVSFPQKFWLFSVNLGGVDTLFTI
jgi:hypothetical protein